MSREKVWSMTAADGGRVVVNDVSELTSFEGYYWVEFCYTKHGNFYKIEKFSEDELDEAKEKAREVADVMNI
jgi:hypothetical protein